MGRSRSGSRSRRGEYEDDGEYRSHSSSKHSRHKSEGKSRSRSRERQYDYEGETKEERRARRQRKRAEEQRREEEEEGRRSRGAYDDNYSSRAGAGEYGPVPAAGYGAAPYPESPQDSRAGYVGGEYQQTSSYPADSYAQSGYASTPGGFPSTEPASTEYATAPAHHGYSGYPPETQSYGAPQSESATYYGHQSPPPAQYAQSPPPAQYGESGYTAAPQPPYPTTQYPEDTPADTSGYYASPPPAAPYPHEGRNPYAPPERPLGSDVPPHGGFNQPQPGYTTPNYSGSGYAPPPQVSSYGSPPRNPSHHNYNPRTEPSGPPPEAEPQFEMAPPPVAEASEQWRPTQPTKPQEKKSFFSSFAANLNVAIHDVARDLTSSNRIKEHHGSHDGGVCTDPNHFHSENRFDSFSGVRHGNKVKWFVDGKDYCWAVAEGIENAKESIWILDWWLSPELHLRRPGAKNEKYRLDRLLVAAAERGVQVKIIVYKEVTQALTLSSAHTKHFLEDQHKNIAVVRHPDHTPDQLSILGKVSSGKFGEAFANMSGMDDRIVLYWAHHEKLCLIDGTVPNGGLAFMGGLDLCWGRWDLAHHPIADVHPSSIQDTVFLGQDYNNGRLMDFHTVDHWEQNKLSRTESSRMGWSDVALCLTGPTVEDLKVHFTERWNFIWREKYYSRRDARYQELKVEINYSDSHGRIGNVASKLKSGVKDAYHRSREESGGYRGDDGERSRGGGRRKDEYDDPLAFGDSDDDREERRRRRARKKQGQGYEEQPPPPQYNQPPPQQTEHRGSHPAHGASCQIVRSCSVWSHDSKTEHSVQNAYIQIINSAQHFIYIENQFFITASGGEGGWPVKNRIGEALVGRIVRAHQNREKFRIIVLIPAVPGFAGPLQDDASLGTRAIMEFQYDSISRGGKGRSIYERLSAQGINPLDYIRFFNLRNYDRLNISRELETAEAQAKFNYDLAQQALENKVGAGWQTAQTQGGELNQWSSVQGGVGEHVWDSVAQCSMLGGGDVRDAPWAGDPEKEIDAFVSEELYIHSKLLIADDKIVICGSANLNDRSQNGDHDSEIAIIIEDHTPLGSLMNGQAYNASSFAATLRRYLFRKHLGLIPAQNLDATFRNPYGDFSRDPNSFPLPDPNIYDFDSEEDKLVMDPLSDKFWDHWNNTAKTNTDAFATVFHPVPYDGVLNWDQYKEYFGKHFQATGTKEKPVPPKYKWGHVVKEEFPPGAEGARAVKEVLSRVRGSLVEMPLKFMQDVDFAVEAASFNALTEAVYI